MNTKTKTADAVITSSTVIEQLGNRLNQIAMLTEALDAKIAPHEEKKKRLEEEAKSLRAGMAEALVGSGRSSVYIGGYQFSLKHDTDFEVQNEALALAWAQEHDCVRIDKVKAKPILRREVMTPDGFARVAKHSVARTADKKEV